MIALYDLHLSHVINGLLTLLLCNTKHDIKHMNDFYHCVPCATMSSLSDSHRKPPCYGKLHSVSDTVIRKAQGVP